MPIDIGLQHSVRIILLKNELVWLKSVDNLNCSFYENKVLYLLPAEEGFIKVLCFHKIKIAQTLV